MSVHAPSRPWLAPITVHRSRVVIDLMCGLAAAGVMLSADVHFDLWYAQGFREVDTIGPLFLLNAIGGLIIGLVLICWRHWLPALAAAGFGAATLVSYISSRCTWLTEHPPGDNCFVLEDNTVQPFVKIGNDVTLWSGNHIGHDAVIDDHCFISSHVVISGRVHVGEYCFLGVNATIRNAITIAPETLVGAGAIVMADTAAKSVYVPERTGMFPRTSDKIKI